MWILFIFRENILWLDILCEAKVCMIFLTTLKMENQLRNITSCDECNSNYYTDISQMENLCPECSYILYGCQNCNHDFENGRCRKCFWNGSVSDYIQNLKDKNLNKSKKILSIIDFFQAKYGTTNILIIDHWDSDKEAIGLTEKSKQFLAYISTISDRENDYYLALENPSGDNELPYSPIEFYNLSLIELEDKLIKHLKLAD